MKSEQKEESGKRLAIVDFPYPPVTIFKRLCDVGSYLSWNPSLERSEVVLPINFTKTSIIRQVDRKGQEFIFLRHAIEKVDRQYIIEKSFDKEYADQKSPGTVLG